MLRLDRNVHYESVFVGAKIYVLVKQKMSNIWLTDKNAPDKIFVLPIDTLEKFNF